MTATAKLQRRGRLEKKPQGKKNVCVDTPKHMMHKAALCTNAAAGRATQDVTPGSKGNRGGGGSANKKVLSPKPNGSSTGRCAKAYQTTLFTTFRGHAPRFSTEGSKPLLCHAQMTHYFYMVGHPHHRVRCYCSPGVKFRGGVTVASARSLSFADYLPHRIRP